MKEQDKEFSRIGENELLYLKEVLSNNFRSSKSATMMKKLEESFASKYGMRYAISFVNGTATMHAALEAMGIGPGDEVIVPPLTMSSTSFAVLQANATPIFADVDEDTFEIDLEAIKQVVSPKTKAIITVALYGLSPDIRSIVDFAHENGIRVIEDNAEAFGSWYDGQLVGTFGDCSSFSFQSSKHLTSGEGGIVLTNDIDLANKIRQIQSLGYAGVGASSGKITKTDIQDPNYMRHATMGWNYRMPELCCAVALAQVERMEELVDRRIRVAELFTSVTSKFPRIIQSQRIPSNAVSSHWTFVARLVADEISWHDFRAKFLELGGDGIYAAWQLTYLEPMFQKRELLGRENFISDETLVSYKQGLCPTAEKIQPRLLQFKTNYWNWKEALEQAKILESCLMYFDAQQ